MSRKNSIFFTKVHGNGNDFVLINALGSGSGAQVAYGKAGERNCCPGKDSPEDLGAAGHNHNRVGVALGQDLPEDLGGLAREICNRHTGVGADGLVLILSSEQADVRMRIFNSDGSEAQMCGNAIRCVARYLYERGLVPKKKIKVDTLAGIIVPEIVLGANSAENKVSMVKVDMGKPMLERSDIPMLGPPGKVVGEKLAVDGREIQVTAVSMGNPHCVIFVDDVDEFPLDQVGPAVERHPSFPERTNVEFVQVMNWKEVRMRVWERGAGETLACGTGACATTVAGVLNNLTGRTVTVHLKGGDLTIEWGGNGRVYMTGPAEEIFEGRYFL